MNRYASRGSVNLKTGMNTTMKAPIIALLLVLASVQPSFAQDTSVEQEIVELSVGKWQWMAEQNSDTLAALFHEDARFVHMGGTWGTDAELEIIRSGSIHYKQADVHDMVVEVFDDTAVVWNRITLVAEVGGHEVTNPFTVTEVYQRAGNGWKLLAMTFSSVRDTHTLEH